MDTAIEHDDIAPFVPRTALLGLKIDVSNVADALDHLEVQRTELDQTSRSVS